MKTSVNKIIFIFIVSMLAGCSKYYSSTPYLKPGARLTQNAIQINDTYRYYIRQLYKQQKGEFKDQQPFSGKSKATDLIEIEYLFISEKEGKAIYISTVPDKYQQYYSDLLRYLGENSVNVYDFKKISFGKLLDASTVEFISKSGKTRDVWNLKKLSSKGNDFVIINTLEKYNKNEFTDLIPVSQALENEISFKNVPSFTIIFFRHDKTMDLKAVSIDNTIHINQRNGKYELNFKFDKKIFNESADIYFSDERVAYSPDSLIK